MPILIQKLLNNFRAMLVSQWGGAMINGPCGTGRERTDFTITLSSFNIFQFSLHSYIKGEILRLAMYFLDTSFKSNLTTNSDYL